MIHFKDIYDLPVANPPPRWMHRVNRLLARAGLRAEVVPMPDHAVHMNTPEQRMNFYLLGLHVVLSGVEGDWAEFGCFSGQSAMVFQKVLDRVPSGRRLILYDSFKTRFRLVRAVRAELVDNFRLQALTLPVIEAGDFEETVPARLPDRLSLVHIDAGTGQDPAVHEKLILFLLENVYPRLSPGGVIIFSDYHDSAQTVRGFDSNPGVKRACDRFFADKPETVYTLYGNQYSHGMVVRGRG